MILTCPKCGAREDETINGMFSGPEPSIRRRGNVAECVKCGFEGMIPNSTVKVNET
ncbi:unnamed protein product [marine sediment metagenome]|uniref:Uncharacterized protein n=1 Tax=marine sediment metagenome TaxID=412755 RepID=X0W2H8_9ZZZZ